MDAAPKLPQWQRGNFERLAEACFGQPTVEKAMDGFFNGLLERGPEMTDPEKRVLPGRSRPISIIIVIVLLILAGFLAWRYLLPRPEPPVREAAVPSMDGETAPAPSKETGVAPPEPSGEKPSQPEAAGPQPPKKEDPCDRAAKEIKEFFARLDRAEYVRKRTGGTPAEVYLGKLTDKLLANPPIIVGETENLFSILSNTAHFYRILKKDDVLLVKEILEAEGEALEEHMALFYNWSLIGPECAGKSVSIHLPLPGLYEYASFFLNTLGGRSYLFRRESRFRMLIKYYSLLILDRANDQALNKYGVDIRPPLASLMEEMEQATNLKQKDAYLAELARLSEKYQQAPSSS